MRSVDWAKCALLASLLAGCDSSRGPRLGQGPAPADAKNQEEPNDWIKRRIGQHSQAAKSGRYHGKTVDEWAQLLNDSDREEIARGAQALWVLGARGRRHLMEGLESPSPETRRICLETLTVSDFKAEGEQGRLMLMKLMGDHADFRIRQIADSYIRQWSIALPSPP